MIKKSGFRYWISEWGIPLTSAVILAVLIRSFVFEPFKIPSGSMIPTLFSGDHIFVKRFAYGLRIPGTKIWLAEFDGPARGDVVVFNFPLDEGVHFIKRIVGLPGDQIKFRDGKLFINNQKVDQQNLGVQGLDPKNACNIRFEDESTKVLPEKLQEMAYYNNFRNYDVKLESLSGLNHFVQNSKLRPKISDFEVTVPPRSYFVMGDNRDESRDSRTWGFVPRENLKGKAEFIWLSINDENGKCEDELFVNLRFDRFGKIII